MIRRAINLAGAAALALAIVSVALAAANLIADAPGTIDRLSGSVWHYRGGAPSVTAVPVFPPGIDVLNYDANAPGGVAGGTPTPAPSTGLVAVRAVPTETPVPAEITVTATPVPAEITATPTPIYCYVRGSGVIACTADQATAAAVAARTPPPAEVTDTATATPGDALACESSYDGCQPTPTPDIASRHAAVETAVAVTATAFARR